MLPMEKIMIKRTMWVTMLLAVLVAVGCEKKASLEEQPLEMEIATENMTISPDETMENEDLVTEINADDMTSNVSATSAQFVPDANMPSTGGFSNVSIADIQKALKAANLYSGTVDGVNCPKTKKAVKEFQTQNNLKADGKVGPKTWKKLEPYLSSIHQSGAVTAGN